MKLFGVLKLCACVFGKKNHFPECCNQKSSICKRAEHMQIPLSPQDYTCGGGNLKERAELFNNFLLKTIYISISLTVVKQKDPDKPTIIPKQEIRSKDIA